jgi:hypothetical protein
MIRPRIQAHVFAFALSIAALVSAVAQGARMRGLTPEREAKRVALNTWIRTSHAYDDVIDLDHAMRSPADTPRALPTYDAGDHLHLKDADYKAMGESIDLKLFTRRRP